MKKSTIQYILALIACFAVGCGIALGLNAYDRHSERITPISGGQTVDFSAYGFTLTVPDDFSLNDYTTNNAAEGGNALFAGCVYGSLGELYLFCYANESGDSLRQHREQDVVTYYMNAGATDVRLRTLGGRRFICYRATVRTSDDGEETWDTYETWDGDIQLSFETRMSPGRRSADSGHHRLYASIAQDELTRSIIHGFRTSSSAYGIQPAGRREPHRAAARPRQGAGHGRLRHHRPRRDVRRRRFLYRGERNAVFTRSSAAKSTSAKTWTTAAPPTACAP